MRWNRVISALHTQRYYALVFLTVGLGIALSGVAFSVVRSSEQHEIKEDFNQTASDRALALESSITTNVAVMHNIRSLYEASIKVERHEFRAFVDHALREHPGIQALEWIPRVPASEREAYEEAARQGAFPQFKIVERAAQGIMAPAGSRKEYFPVYYVEPYEGNEAALGFDLASNPIRLAALDKSRDTGQGVATARITLVQESEDQFGFLIFQPIYRNGFPAETLAQRRENLAGFALGVFRIKDMLEHSLARSDAQNGGPGLDIQLYDRSAPREQQLLFTTVSANGAAGHAPPRLSFTKTFDVAGRTWELILTSPAAGLSVWSIWQAWAVLAGGLLFTGLLSAYLLGAARRTAAVERLVAARTVELSQSNGRLEEEITERQRAEEAVQQANLKLEDLNQNLELRVKQRTHELEEANQRLLDAQDQMVRTEKLAAIGQLSGGVAHDLRSPLGAINNAIFYLKKRLIASELVQSNPRIGQFLQIIEDQVQHSNQIITDLMGFARTDNVSLAPTNLVEVVEDALSTLETRDDVQITTEFDPTMPEVLADREQIRRVVINLAANAQDAMPEGGKVKIATQQLNGFVELVVSDSGAGISHDNLKKVFDPLFTTKAKGTGLGLAICQQIVNRHGGTIEVASELGAGSVFTVRLPLNRNE